MKRKVLVIGGAGYVGSKLTTKLLDEKFDVHILDTFWYGEDFHRSIKNPGLRLFKGDIRNIAMVNEAMNGCTDVIHLACISNDPSFDLDPKLGKSINLESFLPIVQSAKNNGIQKFIYASSSSVYGVKQEEKVTEDLPLEPLTDYSKFKAECEKILFNETNDKMTAVVVRPATVCGVSPRQRFDLAVNILTINALVKQKISVFGGEQFRPNLHIDDMCESYTHLLRSADNLISNKTFNVGAKNHSLSEIATTVQKLIGKEIEIEYKHTNDVRSYRVDSSKIKNELGYSPIRGVEQAINDLIDAYNHKQFINPLSNMAYTNIFRMKELKLA